MKLRLHHINLATENVERMERFYREVLDLPAPVADIPVLEKTKGYAGDVGFAWDGNIQLHIAQKDMMAGFRTGQIVNPVERGHIAYRCDDIEAVKRELEEKGVAYSDWGDRAVEGWHQIFFYDPDGNVIEIHQKKEG
ncbi:VOC family protein [Marimonas lutisalis]|uniref:VOC family protein n=1 Tax=Marimonas lutisalis TaxID=2545756 RepID=UPI0010F5754D|nr:VOC family protein [Marimonas lutisalis]